MRNGEERTVCCAECGKQFLARSNSKKLCDDCKEKLKIDRQKERAKTMKSYRAENREKERKNRKPATIGEISAKAKENHMTYGEYVAKFGG